MFAKKNINVSEGIEKLNVRQKINFSLQEELNRLRDFSTTQLSEYQIRNTELEKSLLESKVFPCLSAMKDKPTYKNKISRYDHTLNCLKGLLALAMGEKKGEALFFSFIPKLDETLEKPINSKHYFALAKEWNAYLKDPEILLFLTAIILMHESGNIDSWNPRHFEDSIFNAAFSMMKMGFSKEWYELSHFVTENFIYFREFATGDVSLKAQQSVDTKKFPEKYRDIDLLSFCCRLLTIIDVNASDRIFLTERRLECIKKMELLVCPDEPVNEFYLEERFTLLREDIQDLNEGNVDNNYFKDIYFRYGHTVINTKNEDGSYLFSKEQVKDMINAVIKLARITQENKMKYKYIILEDMGFSALHELGKRLYDASVDVELSDAGTIYFLKYQVILDGDYLIIYNR